MKTLFFEILSGIICILGGISLLIGFTLAMATLVDIAVWFGLAGVVLVAIAALIEDLKC